MSAALEGRRVFPLAVGSQRTTALLLFLSACAIRLVTLVYTIDVPGDGPAHAMMAYAWSTSPFLITDGVWLPGFTYLAGTVGLLVHDPSLAPRLVNLLLGSLTVPIFYALLLRIYGKPAAALSAFILTILPLHVALSASSLTEATFIFTVVAAVMCLMRGAEADGFRPIIFGLFVLLFVFAEATRYEAWALVPVVVGYYHWQHRRLAPSVVLTLTLLAFPLAWSVEAFLHSGDPLYGVTKAVSQPEFTDTAVGAFAAARLLGSRVVRQTGWFLPLAALVGLTSESRCLIRRALKPEQLLYLILSAACWSVLFGFTMSRGDTLWARYTLCALVFALPFAALGWVRCVGSRRQLAGILAFAVSLGVPHRTWDSAAFVTRKQPTEMVELAKWLQDGAYAGDAVVLTKMDWESTYVRLYAPQTRVLIIWAGASDAEVTRFMRDWRPRLLVSRASDAPHRERLERLLDLHIGPERLIHTIGTVQIYDLHDWVVPKPALQ